MAVLQDYQKKGIGEMLVNCIEKELKNNTVTIIWCNARELAVNFYKKIGYTTLGDMFEIIGVGAHFFMFKKI
jgi:ribosomal protein S18 acetylase RimI-like enzyme